MADEVKTDAPIQAAEATPTATVATETPETTAPAPVAESSAPPKKAKKAAAAPVDAAPAAPVAADPVAAKTAEIDAKRRELATLENELQTMLWQMFNAPKPDPDPAEAPKS